MQKRKYRLKQRAVQQQETRERIVDAAVALHEELGPAATTISALADRAGVQRLTVYRHFADEREILKACSTKWLAGHPPPDPRALVAQEDPARQTQSILAALYGYYERTQGMWRSLYHDRGHVDALEEPMQRFDGYLASLADMLLAARPAPRSKGLRATVAHALAFSTWQSLDALGLGRNAMAALVGSWIEAAAA